MLRPALINPMKRPFGFILSLVVFGALAGRAGATAWLDDVWADGTRNNQNPPADSAWFCSTGSSLTAATNAMSLTVGSGSVMAVTYFTTNMNVPLQIAAGDTLIATFRITLTGVAPANTSQGFKIGIFDLADSTLSPKRLTADSFSTRSQGAGVQGYSIFQNMGASYFAGHRPRQHQHISGLRKRNAIYFAVVVAKNG
jgi:hypothetical protein